MRLSKTLSNFFKSHKTSLKIFMCVLTVLIVGTLGVYGMKTALKKAYDYGYERGRDHPRYMARDTGSTFSFVSLD